MKKETETKKIMIIIKKQKEQQRRIVQSMAAISIRFYWPFK